MLCPIAFWDCFGDAISSFIGYYKVSLETGSKSIGPSLQTILKCNLNENVLGLSRNLNKASEDWVKNPSARLFKQSHP